MASKSRNWSIERNAFFALIIYPLIIILLGAYYTSQYGIHKLEIILFVGAYYITNISIGVALHRMWAHSAFKTNSTVEFIFAMLTAGALQGPAIAWASDHQKHHTFTDKEGDPHSPLKYKNKFIGFLWSHMGWMLISKNLNKHIDKATLLRLGKKPILLWQFKYYWYAAWFMNLVLPPIIGFLITQNLQGALAGYIFIGLGRAIQQHMTFCVNSLCHLVGNSGYSNTSARDIWWMAIFLLGENWHNFHHAFARDYRNGHKWYHFDVHKWIIAAMSKVGLAWDIVCTPKERIEAKRAETMRIGADQFKRKLEIIEIFLGDLTEASRQKMAALEHSTIGPARETFKQKLRMLEDSALKLKLKIEQLIKEAEIFEEKTIKKISKSIHSLEKLAKSLGVTVNRVLIQI